MSDMPKRLYRSRAERMFLGVCGGLGDLLQADPTILRLLFVAAVFFAGPGVLFAYLIMALIVPLQPVAGNNEVVAS